MVRRSLAVTLALIVIVTLAAPVFAAEVGSEAVRNATTGKLYASVSEGVLDAADGETVQLLRDTEDRIITVLEGVTLDLNGYTLDSEYMFCAGSLVDNSESNSGLLNASRLMICGDNPQLPVKDAGGGYRFVELLGFNSKFKAADTEGAHKYVFQTLFEKAAHEYLLAGEAVTGVSIMVRVSWTNGEGRRSQDFIYGAANVNNVLGSYDSDTGAYGRQFALTLLGAAGHDNLTYQILVESDTGVVAAAEAEKYEAPPADEEDEEVQPDGSNILITNEEFLYGSYFDHDRVGHNNRITSGAYGLIRSADALLPAQDITVKVTDTDLTNYKVTLGYFDKDGNYTGRTGILPMTNGELTIKASEMRGSYFRVNVYIYNGSFTKVPASAQIVVYGGSEKQPDQTLEGKKISIVGDSISTGGYPSILASMTGATIQNLSASGAKLAGTSAGANTLVNKITGVAADTDLVIVFGGTNDYWHKTVAIGTADSIDANTYCGALNYLQTNHADAEYLFVFPPDQTFGGSSSDIDFGHGTLDDFRMAFLNFCENNSAPYVDLGDTEFNASTHTGDGVHPNSSGHQIIAEAIYAAISENP